MLSRVGMGCGVVLRRRAIICRGIGLRWGYVVRVLLGLWRRLIHFWPPGIVCIGRVSGGWTRNVLLSSFGRLIGFAADAAHSAVRVPAG